MPAPRLVVGLGNPGSAYAGTRHNAGFWLAERIADLLGVPLRREARFHGRLAHARAQGLWLLEPLTYMNRAGIAVSALARFFRIDAADIVVLHDELDLPPGALRLKFGGGLGGHNGLKDIVAHLGTQDFWRLRIGIGHPGHRDEVIGYVLKPPPAQEREEIERALERAAASWPTLARGDYQAAMRSLNARPAAAAPEPD